MRRQLVTIALAAACLAAGDLAAQAPAAPAALPLLDHLAGRWAVTGRVRGQ